MRIKPRRRIKRDKPDALSVPVAINQIWSMGFEQAQLLATQWLWAYNNERPHSAIGGVPPRQLLNAV